MKSFKKKKCLFLGYNKKQTNLIKFLENRNFKVSHTQNKINEKKINKYDLIISFGYKKIIDYKFLKKLSRPIINLHIGYLPFNRGAHPNLWSFLDNTPSGVTIHEVDKGIDTGDILFQKKIDFNSKHKNFSQTYKHLKNEIEKLFFLKFNEIVKKKYKKTKQRGIHTFHKIREKPNFIRWDMNIEIAKKKYDKFLEKETKKNLSLINEIENVRGSNNVNWMDILRLGIIKSPKDAKNIIKKINSDDDVIGSLLKKLT